MIDFEKIAALPEFQSAPREKQNMVRDLYFKNYMEDQLPPEQKDRAYREFVYGGPAGREPVLSTLTPEREQADKGLIRKGLEWGAEKLGIPFEPSPAMRSEEGARAVVAASARDAGLPEGEYRVGPQALNQVTASFADTALGGIPGAIRRAVTGGDGLAPEASTSEEKIASGIGIAGGLAYGAPMGAIAPISKAATPIVRGAVMPEAVGGAKGYEALSQFAAKNPKFANLAEELFSHLPWWKRVSASVSSTAPALAAGTAVANLGKSLEKPTVGEAAKDIGRATGEGFATGAIFGGAGEVSNRIARIATGLAAMEAERATGLKAPIFDDRPMAEKAFDIAQTLVFLWGKGGNKVLDQAEASLGRRPPGAEAQRQLPAPAGPPLAAEPDLSIHLHERPDITVRDVPPGPPPALVGRRQAVIPPPPVRLALPPPGGEYRGPVMGEGFEMTPGAPRPPIVEMKRRPAAESAQAFEQALQTVQSPQGAALLKSRLAAEQAAGDLTYGDLNKQVIDYRGTGGISSEAKSKGMVPAFRDNETGRVYESQGVHLLDNLPDEVVTQRNQHGEPVAVKGTIVPGFVKEGKFYTRDETQGAETPPAAPMVVPPTMAQLAEQRLGNKPILPPLQQAIAPKPVPAVVAPKAESPTFKMDDDNEAHFEAWLDRTVPDEQRLKEEGWLSQDESLAMVLRDKENLRRGKVAGEGPEKREQDLTAQEKEVKAGMEWEPEEPPKGDYIPMKAGDLPEGKKLTLIDGKTARGWDEYTVKEKDEFGVTLEDGETIHLPTDRNVEVRKEDLPKKGVAPIPANLAEAAALKPQKTAEEVKMELDKARANKAGFDKIQNLQLEYDRLTNAPIEQGKTLKEFNQRILKGAAEPPKPALVKKSWKPSPLLSKAREVFKQSESMRDPASYQKAQGDIRAYQVEVAKEIKESTGLGGSDAYEIAGDLIRSDKALPDILQKPEYQPEPEKPALVLQGERQMPKVQAEMRTRGKKMGKAQQGGIEFGAPESPRQKKIASYTDEINKIQSEINRLEDQAVQARIPAQHRYYVEEAGKLRPRLNELENALDSLEKTPEKIELQAEKVSPKEAAGAEIVKKRLEAESTATWRGKTNKEGKAIQSLPGKGSVSGDDSMGWYAFDQKGRVIGEGNIVDGFKTVDEAKAAVVENAKPKFDPKEDLGSVADRMKDADPELSAARKVAKILMNESGAIDIDFDALKKGIKGLKANLPKKDIGWVTQGFGLPTWVADRYPKSAGKIQEVIDNRFRNKNMIRNEYYRELLDGWDGLSKDDIEKVGKSLWRGDELKKVLGAAGLSKLTPKQRKAYQKTREVLDYIWYEDRPELMRSMGMPNNEISQHYQETGHLVGWMPHERKGRYFGRAIDPTVQPGGDNVLYRKHFDDFLLTLSGQNVGVKQALVKGKLESDFPGKLIEIGENQKAMAEGAYNDVSPEATQELIDASMKYMNAPDSQKAALKTAMRQAVADVFKVRGFGEHFMKRKDVPGFDTSNWQDAVLNYVSSWAGYKSKLMAAREMWDVWGDIDWKGIPKLRKYVSDQVKDTFANETFADRAIDTARGVLFRQYLSGVLKSAFLNLTQPFIATMPRLTTETHWAGVKLTAEMAKAAKDIIASIGTKAQGDMTKRQTAQAGRLTKEELMGIRRARENGIIGSQMTEELLGRAAGKFGSTFRKIDNFLGWAFANAELFNREVSYLSAFRIAKNEKGMNFEDAAKFAETIVDQTQFRYGKTNLPPFARGEHWAAKTARAGYAFRHYPNNLFHLWGKLAGSGLRGAAGIAKSLLALGAFGGVASLPFIHSIAWVYNQITGTDLLSDISEKAGKFSKYALYGVPGGALGVDMSGSLGTDVPTSLEDVGGVMTDWAKRTGQTYEDLEAKDYQRAAEDFPLTPQMIRSPLAGIRMATRGMEKRSGTDVKDDDFETVKLTPGEVAKKFSGFQPVKLSETYRKEQSAKVIKSYWADKADSIRRQARTAHDEGTDSKQWSEAVDAVRKFNGERPNYIAPIDLKTTIMQKPGKREVLLKREIK